MPLELKDTVYTYGQLVPEGAILVPVDMFPKGDISTPVGQIYWGTDKDGESGPMLNVDKKYLEEFAKMWQSE